MSNTRLLNRLVIGLALVVPLLSTAGCIDDESMEDEDADLSDGKDDSGSASLIRQWGLLKPTAALSSSRTFTRLLLQRDEDATYGYFFLSVGNASGDVDDLEGSYRLRWKNGKRVITFDNEANETVGGDFYYTVTGSRVVLDAVNGDNALDANRNVTLKFQSMAEIKAAIKAGYVADLARTNRRAISPTAWDPEITAAVAAARTVLNDGASGPVAVHSITVDFETYYSLEFARAGGGIFAFVCDPAGTTIARGSRVPGEPFVFN